MSNSQNSYNKVSQKQQSGQGSPIYQYYPPNDFSPFRKHLPMIPQSQVSPQAKLAFQNIDGVIESQEYLGQSFQSRLYEQGQMKGSLMSQSGQSGLMSPRQKKILLNKIYQKQKQLVLLQDKLYMLKNTNQCLRDTIKQNNTQKDNLIEQLQILKKQNVQYKQKITRLQQQLSALQQQLITVKETQQQKYFKQNNIMSKSRKQLLGQNESLQQSIREMTAMYEREIAIILQKHEQVKQQIQVKWSLLMKQKDSLIQEKQKMLVEKQGQMQQKQLMILNERDQMRENIRKLQQELEKVMKEKKILLQQYLQAIQNMKQQMKHINSVRRYSQKKQIISQTIIPSSQQPTSQNILIQHQDSYQQLHNQLNQSKEYIKKIQQNINNSQQKQQNIQTKLKCLQTQNQLMKNIITNSCKQNLQTSRKLISNNNYDTQQLLSKANSISSLKPVRDLNTSYIADRLNQTMMIQYPDRYNSINSYSSYHLNNLINKRSTSNSRSNSRPHMNNSKIITSEYRSKSKLLKSSTNPIMNPYSIKPSMDFTIINSSKIDPLENCQNTRIFNQRLYKEIDNKLDQIKYQINKQITY